MRVGLGPADALPDSQAIAWSEWIAVRQDTQTAERTWYQLITPEMVPSVGRVKLIVQCNADLPADISAGFWDAERIEQYVDVVEPPEPPEQKLRSEFSQTFSPPFLLFRYLTSRVGNRRASLGRSLCSLLSHPFVCEYHSISTMLRFLLPPPQTQRADFPHYAYLKTSHQGL